MNGSFRRLVRSLRQRLEELFDQAHDMRLTPDERNEAIRKYEVLRKKVGVFNYAYDDRKELIAKGKPC